MRTVSLMQMRRPVALLLGFACLWMGDNATAQLSAAQTAAVSALFSRPPNENHHPPLSQFLLLYSYSYPAETIDSSPTTPNVLTSTLLNEVVAANYNTIMCGQPDVAAVGSHGLKCMVIGYSSGANGDYVGESIAPSEATTLAGNPATWGYYITDEPDNSFPPGDPTRGTTLDQLAAKAMNLNAADPNHPTWINLSPGAYSSGYLQSYVNAVPVNSISFDSYPWWFGLNCTSCSISGKTLTVDSGATITGAFGAAGEIFGSGIPLGTTLTSVSTCQSGSGSIPCCTLLL